MAAMSADPECATQDDFELADSGRVLVRASGTEPLVRVMVEAETEDLARRHMEAIAGEVRKHLGASAHEHLGD